MTIEYQLSYRSILMSIRLQKIVDCFEDDAISEGGLHKRVNKD